MEADWERNVPQVVLDLDGIATLLAPLGIDARSVTLIDEGKANTGYCVEASTGPVLLRILQRDPRNQRNEALLAARLRDLVPAPALLAEGDGFLVYEWRRGVTLERALYERRDLPYERIALELAMVRLALDALTFPESGLFNDGLVVTAAWSSAVQAFFGYARNLLDLPTRDLDLNVRAAETIAAAESHLMAIQGPPVLVHGDFKPSNLLVDETGLTAVLDWEFAHAGTRLADVGQILRFQDSLPEGFASAFLQPLGLNADDALLARTLDLANLVDMHATAPHGSRRKRDLSELILLVCDLYECRFA